MMKIQVVTSLFFTLNIKDSLKEEIKEILGVVEMEGDAKYLGLPLVWGKSKKEFLGYFRDKIMKKVQGWGNKDLNHAGKDVLIKSVLQPIPMYTFMCFKAPQSLCSCLNSAISNFWWGRSDTGNKIHWGAWQKLTDQKGMGDMGFKDFESFNVVLLAKQLWRLIKEPNSLWARIKKKNSLWAKVLKGLYFPKKECIEATRGSMPSWIWCSLLEGRNLIKEGLQWNVGSGDLINFWDDQWVPGIPEGKVVPLQSAQIEPARVIDFIKPISKEWDKEKLRTCILEEQVQAVCRIPISLSKTTDNLIWWHTNSGKYTVKSGYFERRMKISKSMPSSASSSFTPSKTMWTKLWGALTVPKVRMFMWRAARNWLACKANLFRRKCAPNPLCPICENASETVEHMLFHCP